MNELTRAKLATDLQAACDMTEAKARTAVDTVFADITQTLLAGGRVKLAGIGSLSIKPTKGRDYKNPTNGAVITVPPGKKVSFKISRLLKNQLTGA